MLCHQQTTFKVIIILFFYILFCTSPKGHTWERLSLWIYVGKVTVNPRQVTIVMIGEASSWQSVPECRGSRDETLRVEFISPQWNTELIRVSCYHVLGLAGLKREE